MSIDSGGMDRGIKFSTVGRSLSELGFFDFQGFAGKQLFFNRLQPQRGDMCVEIDFLKNEAPAGRHVWSTCGLWVFILDPTYIELIGINFRYAFYRQTQAQVEVLLYHQGHSNKYNQRTYSY